MENKKKNTIYIGAVWDKVAETKNGDTYEYLSVAFKGASEKDEYEVVLRRKSDGQELDLSKKGVFVTIVNSKDKKSEKHPDRSIKVDYA